MHLRIKSQMVNKILVVLLITLISSCSLRRNTSGNYEEQQGILNEINIRNSKDSLVGFYKIVNDSFFFISKWDLNHFDSLCIEEYKEKISMYYLFSLQQSKRVKIQRNLCETHPIYGSIELRDIRNFIYPPQKIDEELYQVKHVSVEYNSTDPFIRTFEINEKLEVLRFSTEGNLNSYYFFYD